MTQFDVRSEAYKRAPPSARRMEEPHSTPTQFDNAFRVDLLEKVPPARLLVLLAGASAVVLGLVTFFMQWSMGPRIGPLGLYGTAPLILMLLIDLAFGAFLLYAYMGMQLREVDWSPVVLGVALVLLVLGGIAGAVAGILAGVAAVFVLVRSWRTPRVA